MNRFGRPVSVPAMAAAWAALCGCGERPPLIDAAQCQPENPLLHAPFSLPAETAGASTEPHMATDGHGNLLVAWIGSGAIGYSISHDDGVTFEAPRTLPPGAASDPSVATDRAGSFYVTWLDSPTAVFVNRIDAATGEAEPSVSVTDG